MSYFRIFVLVLLSTLPVSRATAAAKDGAEPVTASAALNVADFRPGQQAVIAVVADVADGYHTASHEPGGDNIPFTVQIDPNAHVEAFAAIYPRGRSETYPNLGTLNVYTDRVVIYIPIRVKSDAAPIGPITLKGTVKYQACNDRVCFLPQSLPWSVQTPLVALNAPPTTPATPIDAELFKAFDPAVFATLPASVTAARQQDKPQVSSAPSFGIIGAILAALGAGLILNVMPCVLPVLPLKAMGFFQAAEQRRGRALAFGIAFSVGMVAMFGVLAVLVLVFKQGWGELFSHAWFTWLLVTVLTVFGVAQIVGSSISLPSRLYNVTFRHDTLVGNFNFGAFTAILSTPCTGPLFPPLLTWASAAPTAIGVTAIMTVGVGMALPYLILSAFPKLARKFPRTGAWSELIKQMTGCMLLAVAAYFAGQRLIAGEKFWWLVFAAIVLSAGFLVVRTAQLMPRHRPIAIAMTIAMIISGAALVITLRLAHNHAIWTPYSDSALADARRSGKPVIVKFTANWCANCQYVEATVFHDEATLKQLRRRDVRMIKADLTSSTAAGWPLLKSLNASGGIPLTAVYLAGRDEPTRLESIYTSPALLGVIDNGSHDLADLR